MIPALPSRRPTGLLALICLALLAALPSAEAWAEPVRNGRLAFEAGRDPTRFGPVESFSIAASGRDLLPITPLVASGVRYGIGAPSWSPDGRRVVFARFVDGGPDLFVANADGSDERRITDDPAWDYEPAWSPDGSRIAFMTSRFFDGVRSGAVVASVAPDGSDLVRLTSESVLAGTPAWSPDGRWLAFANTLVDEAQPRTVIWLMSTDGTVSRAVTDGPYDRDPSITSRSRGRLRIAYTARDGVEGDADVARVTVRTRGRLRVSRPRRMALDLAHEFDPAWSPDGRRLAFARYQEAPEAWSRLMVRDVRGGREDELLPARAAGSGLVWFQSPAWAPCGPGIGGCAR